MQCAVGEVMGTRGGVVVGGGSSRPTRDEWTVECQCRHRSHSSEDEWTGGRRGPFILITTCHTPSLTLPTLTATALSGRTCAAAFTAALSAAAASTDMRPTSRSCHRRAVMGGCVRWGGHAAAALKLSCVAAFSKTRLVKPAEALVARNFESVTIALPVVSPHITPCPHLPTPCPHRCTTPREGAPHSCSVFVPLVRLGILILH